MRNRKRILAARARKPKPAPVLASNKGIREMQKRAKLCRTFLTGRHEHRDTDMPISRAEFWSRLDSSKTL